MMKLKKPRKVSSLILTNSSLVSVFINPDKAVMRYLMQNLSECVRSHTDYGLILHSMFV